MNPLANPSKKNEKPVKGISTETHDKIQDYIKGITPIYSPYFYDPLIHSQAKEQPEKQVKEQVENQAQIIGLLCFLFFVSLVLNFGFLLYCLQKSALN